jgi:hypothetical protein
MTTCHRRRAPAESEAEQKITRRTLSLTCHMPCRGSIRSLTLEEAERLHRQVPDWQLLDDAHRIERRTEAHERLEPWLTL